MAEKGCKVQNPVSVSEIFTFSKQKFSKNYSFKGESHDFYEAVCVLKGTVGVTSGKKVYLLSKGQMTVHRPGEFHAIWEHSQSKPVSVILTFCAAPFPKFSDNIFHLSDDLQRKISGLYDRLTEIFEMRPLPLNSGVSVTQQGIWIDRILPGKEYKASIFIKELELFFAKALDVPLKNKPGLKSRSYDNYIRILDCMENHISENLTVADIANECKMSIPALEKTVHRYLGCGAAAYYDILKLEKAVKLLASGCSVKECALMCGYSNQNYFSACFKKKYGYPPSKASENA